MSDDLAPLAGSAFTALIDEQLVEERATKASLEQRGAFIITSAGTLATLLLGLAALVTSQTEFRVSHESRILVAASVLAFVLAALAGLLSSFPFQYREVDTDGLERLIQSDLWVGPVVLAARRTAEVRVEVLRFARAANARKAVAIRLGLGAEIVAIALLAAAVVRILVG